MSGPVITIELVGEPKGKGRPRFTRGGIAYTPAETRKHEAALRYAAQEQMNGRAPLNGPLTVTITATFPIPTSWPKKKRAAALAGEVAHTSKPDIDNLIKSIDALNQICWTDDKQIVRATVLKLYGERPNTRIEIREFRREPECGPALPVKMHVWSR
jgi:Holliday junction resolvase RusA-like endonuclease